jgi:hypothetical protein
MVVDLEAAAAPSGPNDDFCDLVEQPGLALDVHTQMRCVKGFDDPIAGHLLGCSDPRERFTHGSVKQMLPNRLVIDLRPAIVGCRSLQVRRQSLHRNLRWCHSSMVG